MVVSHRIGAAVVSSALLAGLLILSQPARSSAQGNGNGVAGRVAALESAVANLTSTVNALQARVGALEGAGQEATFCFDLIADTVPSPIVSPLFVGRVMLSAVPQGSQGFHKLVGSAIDWEFGGSSFNPAAPQIFDPLYGSAFVTSTGDLRFAFFVGTEAPKYQEVRGTLNAPLFQTGSFSLRITDDSPTAVDYVGHVAAATCPVRPQ
jgi:hypothetical protein